MEENGSIVFSSLEGDESSKDNQVFIVVYLAEVIPKIAEDEHAVLACDSKSESLIFEVIVIDKDYSRVNCLEMPLLVEDFVLRHDVPNKVHLT